MMKANTIMADCVIISSLRLSMLSAITPPIRAKNRIGIEDAKPTTPSQKAELVSFSTSQPWATFCIQVPMFERKLPIQNRRKSRWRKAWAIRGSWATAGSAASVKEPCANPSAASARGRSVSSTPGSSPVAQGLGSAWVLNGSLPSVRFEQMPAYSVSFFVSPQSSLEKKKRNRLKYAKLTVVVLLFVLAGFAQQNSSPAATQVFGFRDFAQQRQW